MKTKPLTKVNKLFLFILSFFIVSFGQPTAAWWLGLIASACGYAFFLRIIADEPSLKKRFWIGTSWYFCVQLVQIFWMLSHPYNYIYGVYLGIAFLWAVQWGILCLVVSKNSLKKITHCAAIASLWTLLEWFRLFFLSGYSWNPAGLALSGSIYPLQLASLIGVFGFTFLVIFTNASALRAFFLWPKKSSVALWISLTAAPYLFGIWHLNHNRNSTPEETFEAVLVQTAFPAEEALPFTSRESYIAFVLDEWKQILEITKKQLGKKIDILALPEYVVPFGTYSYIFPYEEVSKAFEESFGSGSAKNLPPLQEPLAKYYPTEQGPIAFVNNAFWIQGIANIFNTDVIAGLEDSEYCQDGIKRHYSAAMHFKPHIEAEKFTATRYSKRVLLPMAEYIPFTFFETLAKDYGIASSFTCGDKPVVMNCEKTPFSASICYEETFGDLMSENKRAGAEMLISLSSDVWYPNSELPQLHRDHARLRTIECGIPLLRCCNTGVTCAIDSLGQTVSELGDGTRNSEWLADSLYVSIPKHHYQTLYSIVGDKLILTICFLGLLLFLL